MSNVFEIVSKYCVDKRDQPFNDYVMGVRGWSKETIDQWEIGFFPPKTLLDLKIRVKDSGLSIDDLESVHIVSNYGTKGYQSRFFGRIVFPIKNEFGEYISITGRAIDGSEPKYYNTEFSKGTHLYGLDQAIDSIRKNDIVYVFEGNADVVTAHQYGIKNAVCVMGTAFREDHLTILSGYTSRVVLVFDNDTGGQSALGSFNERGFDRKKNGVKVLLSSFVNFKTVHKDADAFLIANGKDAFLDLMNKNIDDVLFQNKLRSVKKPKKGR